MVYLSENKIDKESKSWFAMRVTYSRELKIKSYLDERNIDSFIPMRYKEISKNGKTDKKLVPVVHNLIFIKADKSTIDEIKADKFNDSLRYIIALDTNKPLIVPDSQMRDFIAVAGKYEEQILYLPPNYPSIQNGDRVRITGGIFAGVEGVFKRIKGGTRVIIEITGIMTVATASIHPSLLEKIV